MNLDETDSETTSRTGSLKNNSNNDAAILNTEPDVILHQPIVSQPSGAGLSTNGPWTYTPPTCPPPEKPYTLSTFEGRHSLSGTSSTGRPFISQFSTPRPGQPYNPSNFERPYTPCGPPPIGRTDLHGSMNNIYAEVKARPVSETISNASVIAAPPPSGSKDWSRDLFDTLKDVRDAKKHKCSALKTFCLECFNVPCMMCDVAHSLGDKSWLPFVPGTGAAFRFKVRILGGIQGSIADDCLVTSCCCPCAVCQMYREIELIGLGTT